ncbi:putative DNA helicase [Dyadobacter jejuensis]|uniref:Putative DNA helicase n=1 Tax=Dyadobacter jejuensis TaxID=1082580 RepID=A0A316AS37_9BACT|nr:AAA domain-containing protein [Dyadobacter jejuensis]PWJ60241.1 putative DNA helicase [Dyadobacter jejuensis]
MDYFKKLQELLQLERDEDRRNYEKLALHSSVASRRAEGLAWYPIAIRGSELGRGDYLTVELERTTHQDLPHQLRFGVPAVLFSNHDPAKDKIEGTIAHQSGNRLKLSLKTDELPDWARDGKLGVELLFDDNSYDEMKAALKRAEGALEDSEISTYLKVLTGQKSATFLPNIPFFDFLGLNASQTKAAQQIVSANELAIVHGPPGTGKTTTLIQAIKALVKSSHQRVLVVAPSNTAVDLLSEKLSGQGLQVLRVGNPAKVSEALGSLTLDHQMSQHARYKDIKTLKKQANEFKNMAHKYKRHFGKSEREQRKALFDEAHKIMKEVGRTEQYILDDLVAKAEVVTATLVGANHYTVRHLTYDTVVIDEAGQALEPACWIPILKGKKLVLAGDHFQLPPTIKSELAAKAGLEMTLLEKLVESSPDAVTMLEEQYRMHTHIMGYSSGVFYQNKLLAHPTVAHRTLYADATALAFIDTAGCGFEEKLEGTSSTNPEEGAFLVRQLSLLISELEVQQIDLDASFPTIGVISPYKQQVHLLKELVDRHPALEPYRRFINVNTIDSFQGQERDVILISLTRSNSEGSIGFLSDIRRMNVAMTRARKKLVMIGDSATLGQAAFYANLITYAEQQDAYHSAWEFVGSE